MISRAGRIDPFDLAAAMLIVVLVGLALLTYGDYGISNDEEVQHRYGELIVNYYASGFADQSLFSYKNLYLYGGLFDVVIVLLGKLLPFDLYSQRHLLCAFAGIAGIGATAATARLVAGPRAGAFAGFALALAGPWYGAMFNHTKDIPFASAMIGALYFLLRLTRDLPAPRARDLVGFGLLTGMALGLRATGLLMIGYAGLAIVLRIALIQGWNARKVTQFAGRSLLQLAPAFLLAYVVMIAAWPWASLAPLNPARAIFAFAHFHYPIRTMLAGEIYDMATVPRWYVPAYLAIRIPLVIFAGAALGIGFAAWSAIKRDREAATRQTAVVMLAFAACFPVICQVLGNGPAFTGMRHFLFVVPPLAVLAGIGFESLLSFYEMRSNFIAAGILAAVAAALIWNMTLLVRLHPHQNLSYNALVGGLEGAQRRYEMDYWVNIMPEAVAGLKAYIARAAQAGAPARVYQVGVCGETFSFEHYADNRMKISGWWKEADYYIAPTHMNCDRVVAGRTIVAIERLGVLIGVVKEVSKPQ